MQTSVIDKSEEHNNGDTCNDLSTSMVAERTEPDLPLVVTGLAESHQGYWGASIHTEAMSHSAGDPSSICWAANLASNAVWRFGSQFMTL